MHATERERLILSELSRSGFISYRELEATLEASAATIRRDLSRLEEAGQLLRVHGGAKLADHPGNESEPTLSGTPFSKSITQNLAAKQAIGKAAASLCAPSEGIMIDGGTTTLQMCPHLDPLGLQVLTNSLHIVNALLPQENTRLLVPSGSIFREQNIILAPAGEESMPHFHAPKLFLGAAAVGKQGVMQADVILVAAERRLIDRADEVVLLVDSSKFRRSSGAVVCGLDEVDVIVTDNYVDEEIVKAIEDLGVRFVIVPVEGSKPT
ncbi:MAG: DeoR/GlpR family DNA-binding transcription regulator [Sphingomonadaceae bacterium]